MKVIKKSISVFLAASILLSTFAITTSAVEEGAILVKELSATVIEPVGGEYMSFEVVSGDPEKYDVIISYWEDSTTNKKWSAEHNMKFIGDHYYTPHIEFTPKDGYRFVTSQTEMNSHINGRDAVEGYHLYSNFCSIWLMDNAFLCVDNRIEITEIHLTLNCDCRGVAVEDYNSYIKIQTDNVTFASEWCEDGIIVGYQEYLDQCLESSYNIFANEFTGKFKGGDCYVLNVGLEGTDGYRISDDVKIYIDDIEVEALNKSGYTVTGIQFQVYTAIQSFIINIMRALLNFMQGLEALLFG